MKSESTIEPERVLIQKVDHNITTIKLRDNISIINRDNRENEDFTTESYVYDEVIIEIPDRDNLLDYVESNFDALFQWGLQKEFEKTLPNEHDTLLAIITGLMQEVDYLRQRVEVLEGEKNV